jgi:hypothetical protein
MIEVPAIDPLSPAIVNVALVFVSAVIVSALSASVVKFPELGVVAPMDGGVVRAVVMSGGKIALGVIGPADPFGDARKRFCASLVAVTASVPLVVTGEPPTVRNGGTVRPTLVTLPVPAGEHAIVPELFWKNCPLGHDPP